MARQTRFYRSDPGNGQMVGGLDSSDLVEGWGDFAGNVTSAGLVKREQYAQFGGQVSLLKVADDIAPGNIGGFYPDSGAGTLPSQTVSGSTIKLASAVLQTQAATLDPIGMLLVTYGVAPTVRRVVAWTSGTQTVTVNRAYSSGEGAGSGVPVTGDAYRLLIDCRWLNELITKVEYSANTNTASGRFVLWDWPTKQINSGADVIEAYRKPRTVIDLEQTSDNTLYQGVTEETSYYQGRPLSVTVRGFMGAQWLLTAFDAGTVSLWMGAK